MQNFTLGAGLASLAFWGFVAAVVVAGIWYDIRRKESQQETLRRLFESGQPIDDKMMDMLLAQQDSDMERPDRTYMLAGLIVLGAAVGLAILGMVLGMAYPDTRLPLLGVSGLVCCVGLGLVAASPAGCAMAQERREFRHLQRLIRNGPAQGTGLLPGVPGGTAGQPGANR